MLRTFCISELIFMKKKMTILVVFIGISLLLFASFEKGEKLTLLDPEEYYPTFKYENQAFKIKLFADNLSFDEDSLCILLYSTRFWVEIEPKGDTLITKVQLYENDKPLKTNNFSPKNGSIYIRIWNDNIKNSVQINGIYKGESFSTKLDIDIPNHFKSVTNAIFIWEKNGFDKYSFFDSNVRISVPFIYRHEDTQKYAGKCTILLFQHGEENDIRILSRGNENKDDQYEFKDFGVKDFLVVKDIETINDDELGLIGKGLITNENLYVLGNLIDGTGIEILMRIDDKRYRAKIPKEFFYSYILAKREAHNNITLSGYVKRILRGFKEIIKLAP